MEQISASPGVYSNESLQHLPPALNIIVIDITNLELPDQMYLYYELNQFIKNLPAGQPLAIYWQSGNPIFCSRASRPIAICYRRPCAKPSCVSHRPMAVLPTPTAAMSP